MRYTIFFILLLNISYGDVAPDTWTLFDKPRRSDKQLEVEGKKSTVDYVGAWKNKDNTLGVFIAFMRPNYCKTQEDIVALILGAVRQEAALGSTVTKVEAVKGNLGIRIFLTSNGKSSDEVILLPSDGGWTSMGINYLEGETADGFKVDEWSVPELSETNQKKYSEAIKWFVGYSDEFINKVLRQSKLVEQNGARQPATAEDSKTEGEKKQMPESEDGSQ